MGKLNWKKAAVNIYVPNDLPKAGVTKKGLVRTADSIEFTTARMAVVYLYFTFEVPSGIKRIEIASAGGLIRPNNEHLAGKVAMYAMATTANPDFLGWETPNAWKSTVWKGARRLWKFDETAELGVPSYTIRIRIPTNRRDVTFAIANRDMWDGTKIDFKHGAVGWDAIE